MSEIPQAAIDAAEKSVRESYGVIGGVMAGQIRYALAAAVPHIAAAERERIRQLAIKVDAASWYDNDGSGIEVKVPFADLLTDPGTDDTEEG